MTTGTKMTTGFAEAMKPMQEQTAANTRDLSAQADTLKKLEQLSAGIYTSARAPISRSACDLNATSSRSRALN